MRISPGLKLRQVAHGGSRGCKLLFEGDWQGKEQKMDGELQEKEVTKRLVLAGGRSEHAHSSSEEGSGKKR